VLDDTGGVAGGYYNVAPADPAALVGAAPVSSYDFMA
jgi:hypothetical protein